MSAQLRRSASKRKNVPKLAAASLRKKVRQSVPASTAVPTPQTLTVDTSFLPATSSAGIFPMLYSWTGTGLYSSARTFPATLMNTDDTILYSRVPVKKEYNTETSQDPQESSLDEDGDSIWLCNVLENIALNDDFRNICQEKAFTDEILITFLLKTASAYRFGSSCEGTAIPDVRTDIDQLHCDEIFPVIEDISKADKNGIFLLVVTESTTPAGYVKLQLVVSTVPCSLIHLPILKVILSAVEIDIERYFKTDIFGRLVLFGFINQSEENIPGLERIKNKPAMKLQTYGDIVGCYRCKTWPIMAQEWLSRHRCNGWPTNEIIREIKSLGFFVVRKGHPFSSEIDLDWRISLSLQERKLMFNLTDVQYKCYVVLKMINRDIIHLDCITTYHWKTCLFYTIEENKANVWKNSLLFNCVKMCINQMLKCVKRGFCPDYFIPRQNLFDGRMDNNLILVSKNKLVEILDVGFACLLDIKSSNIHKYVRLRGVIEETKTLQAESTKVKNKTMYVNEVGTKQIAVFVVSGLIEQFKVYEHEMSFIEFLWFTLSNIQNVDTVFEHTSQETRRALSILEPFFYTCLASNISAMCIQQPNSQVRDFLLLGCYTLFIEGDLPGRLKFISVLYAVGCYRECIWYLNQLDEKYIKNNPSVCCCHNLPDAVNTMDVNISDISQLKMSTCVFFFKSELPIIPEVLKLDIFRYFGISPHKIRPEDTRWCWHYRAVVDNNIYYYFLKFLVKRKLKGCDVPIEAYLDLINITELIDGSNVRHVDVSYNLMAWCIRSINAANALNLLRNSWRIRQYDKGFLTHAQMLKRTHYEFNSAKVHFLVILYNLWFTKKSSSISFCFHCFDMIPSIVPRELIKCTKCDTATYCSKQCQNLNSTIHEAVCKIVLEGVK